MTNFPGDKPAAARLDQVAASVYAWVQPDGTWWLNNAGAVLTDDGVLLVDTCATARRTRSFLDAVDGASGRAPVRLAVNTHQHGDHTYGNSLLSPGTVLIGHELMREGLRVDPVIDWWPPFWSPVPDWGPVTRAPAGHRGEHGADRAPRRPPDRPAAPRRSGAHDR